MQKFRQAYPGIHFEIYDGNTYQLIDMLEKGIIEIGIVRTPSTLRASTAATAARSP